MAEPVCHDSDSESGWSQCKAPADLKENASSQSSDDWDIQAAALPSELQTADGTMQSVDVWV